MRYTNDTDVAKIVTRLHSTKCATEQELWELLGSDAGALDEAISEMRNLGYGIVRDKKRWCMTQITKKLLPWELGRNLETDVLGSHIEYFDSIESTQDYALRLAETDKNNGSVIISAVQSAGRARHAKHWSSPEGGVWMSVIVESNVAENLSGMLPLVASCALCDAIRDVLKIETSLVWPNDLVVFRDGVPHKIAGMIVDATAQNDKIKCAVLGVGINFQIDERTLNEEIRGESIFRAASLFEQTQSVSPKETIQVFLRNLESAWYSPSIKAEQIAAEWTKRTSMIGRSVSIVTADSRTLGTVSRIDSDGALVINDGTADIRFVSGQVTRIV